jgi:hypothetical protein
MLAAAAERRARGLAAAPAPAGWAERLVAWLLPSRGFALPRLAGAVALTALMLVFSGAFVLAPAAADDLPGDTLYGLKRFNESLRLAFTFDPAEREQVVAEQSRTRAEEVIALAAADLEEPVGLLAHLTGVVDDESVSPPRRELSVMTPRKGDTIPISLTPEWHNGTELDLGDYERLVDVPLRSLIELRLVTRGVDLVPLALSIRLVEAAPTVTPTVVPMATLTTTPDATQQPTDPAETPTQANTAEPSATMAPTTAVPPTNTATLAPSPTGTATLAPSPTSAPTESERDESEPLRGELVEKLSGVSWKVADHDQNSLVVTVDVSAIDAEERGPVPVGAFVELWGEWSGRDKRASVAERIGTVVDRCHDETVTGVVSTYIMGSLLRVDDHEFSMRGVDVGSVVEGGTLAEGVAVLVEYRACPSGNKEVVRIVVLAGAPTATPQIEELEGRVGALGDGSFTLEVDTGTIITITVEFEPGVTPITGAASALRVGQTVLVTGRMAPDFTRMIAEAIEVLVEAPLEPAPGAGTIRDGSAASP